VVTEPSKPLESDPAWPRPRALASPPADTPGGPCVAFPARFSSPLLEIATWRCLRDDATLRSERYHAWPAFTFVHEGAFVMHSQGVSAVIDPSQVVFLAAGMPYSTTHSFGVGDRGLSIALHPDLFRELSPEPAPSRIGLRPARFVVQDVDLAQRLQAGGEPLALEEQALELVRDVWQGTAREPVAPEKSRSREEHRDLADRARAILARRFREPLRLAGLARALHVSPFHLSRVFRQQTGLTLRRYLVRLRLLAAVPQTRHAASLSQLALELGFSSHSHFTSAFRQEFGLSPSAARKALCYDPPRDEGHPLAKMGALAGTARPGVGLLRSPPGTAAAANAVDHGKLPDAGAKADTGPRGRGFRNRGAATVLRGSVCR